LLLDDNQRRLINVLKSKGKTILFVGPVDYANNSLESTSRMIEMNGNFVDGKENRVVTDESEFGYTNLKNDSIYIDDDVNVLGKYQNSNKIAFCYKETQNSKIIFCGIGNLDYKSLQKVLKLANVHIYSYEGEPVFVTNNLYGIYAPLHDKIEFHFTSNGIYKDLFTNIEYEVANNKLLIDTSENKAKLFLKLK